MIIDASDPKWAMYPIQPKHIDTSSDFGIAGFGIDKTGISADFIIRLCQQKGGWYPFTKQEIDAFSEEDFWFNELRIKDREEAYQYIVLGEDGMYRVTHRFIARCFMDSPVSPDQY